VASAQAEAQQRLIKPFQAIPSHSKVILEKKGLFKSVWVGLFRSGRLWSAKEAPGREEGQRRFNVLTL
jgi:hypothetical protein